MAESDSIKEVVNQVAIQDVMAVMMVLRNVEAGPQPTSAASQRATETQAQCYSA